ncbi:tRNA-splicing ligase RtcB (3'-phosphate/5'-hydroxy nucleic acid ligase), partial [Candidatus Hakubella thermalkaliphila]
HDVREVFADIFGSAVVLNVVYDVAHNIAKFEEHFGQNLLVHRKGATRALPPLHPQNPERYKKTGHPAIIPGSMNSPSYILTGNDAVRETFCSVNHGAGRVMSCSNARKKITAEAFLSSLGEVMLNTRNIRKLLDEAPMAYKNINEVVGTLNEIGLINLIARLKPLAVIKGEGDD